MNRFNPCPKPEKKVKVKKQYRYVRKKTGEGELFELIWEKRKHECETCGCNLNDFNVSFFSHIIKKSLRESLRLEESNIMIECFSCHRIWDFGTLEQKYKMASFKRKMDYIKTMDNRLYQSIVSKLEDYHGIVL